MPSGPYGWSIQPIVEREPVKIGRPKRDRAKQRRRRSGH